MGESVFFLVVFNTLVGFQLWRHYKKHGRNNVTFSFLLGMMLSSVASFFFSFLFPN